MTAGAAADARAGSGAGAASTTTARLASPADTAALVERIVAAVMACPGVARLAGGPLATYLPGRAVRGVALTQQSVDVAVVAQYGSSLPDLANRIRGAVGEIVVGVPINVTIADLELPAEP